MSPRLSEICYPKPAADVTCLLACNGTIVNDTEMGEVIQLQGDQRKDVQEFLVDKKEGLELDAKTIKVGNHDYRSFHQQPRLTRPNRSTGFKTPQSRPFGPPSTEL